VADKRKRHPQGTWRSQSYYFLLFKTRLPVQPINVSFLSFSFTHRLLSLFSLLFPPFPRNQSITHPRHHPLNQRLQAEVFAGSELFKVTDFKEAPNALLIKGNIKEGAGKGKGRVAFRGGVKKEAGTGTGGGGGRGGGDPTSRADSQALALACFNDIQARLKAVPDLDDKVTLFFQEFPIDMAQIVEMTSDDPVQRCCLFVAVVTQSRLLPPPRHH
jgi:hypothetical protein